MEYINFPSWVVPAIIGGSILTLVACVALAANMQSLSEKDAEGNKFMWIMLSLLLVVIVGLGVSAGIPMIAVKSVQAENQALLKSAILYAYGAEVGNPQYLPGDGPNAVSGANVQIHKNNNDYTCIVNANARPSAVSVQCLGVDLARQQ